MSDTMQTAPSGAMTYAHLTERAARRLGRAHATTLPWIVDPDGVVAGGAAAHRDLLAALAHLGRTLAAPLKGTAARGSAVARRGGGPDARLLRDLERRAAARDWTAPRPQAGAGLELDRAAFLIRAAADLWATHHRHDGQPRSPEASRLRHPATLGAATREWRVLVALAAEIGDHLGALDSVGRPTPDRLKISPPAGNRRDRQTPRLLAMTVARPGVCLGSAPIHELAQRIARLRHVTWSLAERGTAPAAVQGNTAAIAQAVLVATAHVHHFVADSMRPGPERVHHIDAGDRAMDRASAWGEVARLVAALRTADPAGHPVQVERLDIQRLLRAITTDAATAAAPESAWALDRAAESFDEIARSNRRALRAAHRRGDLLLAGRAIPSEALVRRPDLVRARLNDEIIPAPTSALSRVESAYRRLVQEPPMRTAMPETSPPAA